MSTVFTYFVIQVKGYFATKRQLKPQEYCNFLAIYRESMNNVKQTFPSFSLHSVGIHVPTALHNLL
jgi:hypothetical protein